MNPAHGPIRRILATTSKLLLIVCEIILIATLALRRVKVYITNYSEKGIDQRASNMKSQALWRKIFSGGICDHAKHEQAIARSEGPQRRNTRKIFSCNCMHLLRLFSVTMIKLVKLIELI